MTAPIVPEAAVPHLQHVARALMEAGKHLDQARLACGDCEAGRYLDFIGASMVGIHADTERLAVIGIRRILDRRQGRGRQL